MALALTAKKDEMISLASGATFKEISKENFCSIRIPLPPIEYQQKIIGEFNGYKQIIEGARQVIRSYTPNISPNIIAPYKSLEEIAIFKPSKDELKYIKPETNISFVPMATLNTFSMTFEPNEERILADVMSGFTYFRNNDILLAKITPCFENGKAGIARNLTNGIGFGSTEYIVIRANTDIVYPEWIFYHINTLKFIESGRSFMTGTAGQQRIDINYVKQYRIPVPSLKEQKRCIDEIEAEQALINPSKELIDLFTAKIQSRIKEI